MKVHLKNILFLFFVFALFPLFTVHAQDSVKTQNKGQKTKLQVKHGPRFVDKDGDGFNDNAPDHDGDGIPNGLDPDYKRPGKGKKKKFVDLDGDGIDDNIYKTDLNEQSGGMGPKNKATSSQSGETKKKMKRKNSGNR